MTLFPKYPEDKECTDYVLADDCPSAWIEVGGIVVYLVRHDDGVSVDLYPNGREMENELASCWASFDMTETEEEENV